MELYASQIRPFLLTAFLLVVVFSLVGNTSFLYDFCLREDCFVADTDVCFSDSADCYDPLDPNGNITVTFDIHKYVDDGYMARVTIENFYQYRHIDRPEGWQLQWTWMKNEIIWSMSGAFATSQGNCTAFKYQNPHSCERSPVIADNIPEAKPENRSESCCHGGTLSSRAIDPYNSFSSFEILVGNLERNSALYVPPQNLTFTTPEPGYTCSSVVDVAPTLYSDVGGRRKLQVLRTWKSTCTYSSFVAKRAPICCVSLSSFYSPTITSCPPCSCGCKRAGKDAQTCIGENYLKDVVNLTNTIQCTDHMCPVRVHWHLKTNYRDHWRVKLTVSNYNFGINYTDWNLVVQHPGLSKKHVIYSFNSTLLTTEGFADEVALFWGVEFYNKMLLQSSNRMEVGSVTSEILMEKDLDSFTLSNGWGFPRKVYFNGENCEMPLPDDFPMLPNSSSIKHPHHCLFFLLITLHLILKH